MKKIVTSIVMLVALMGMTIGAAVASSSPDCCNGGSCCDGGSCCHHNHK
jgi:hypothetical protein